MVNSFFKFLGQNLVLVALLLILTLVTLPQSNEWLLDAEVLDIRRRD